MRFHTSLDEIDIRSVELPPGVTWHHVREYGSRSRLRAFEIVLEGTSCYGGQWGDRDYRAGTWDEWGVVLGRLFELDPNARVAKVYEGAEHYHEVTGDRFRPDRLPERLCPRHKWNCVDYDRRTHEGVSECPKCGALKRWGPTPPPQPRNDNARTTISLTDSLDWLRTEQRTTPRVWVATPADFLAGHREPDGIDEFDEPDPTLGKYASGGAYTADLRRNPVDLLDRIDELIKEG